MDPTHSSSSSSDEDDIMVKVTSSQIAELMQSVSATLAPEPSIPRTRRAIVRDRGAAHDRLWNDYFADQPTYGEDMFRRRFRMSKQLFLRIVEDLQIHNAYFVQRLDGAGRAGFTPIQKCTSAIRHLAYGLPGDLFDDYLKMSDRTSRESCSNFCQGIIELYGHRYLRRPTWSDLQRTYEVHEAVHGFPGMIGSIDCMHWGWEMCPTAWHGSHTRGDIGHPTLMLQAVASYDLWIWNAYFGQQGSNNDINVFEASPVLEELVSGKAPKAGFSVNDVYYPQGYYLADGIYPEYAIFVKTFTDPIDDKRKHFKKKQESARKDVERAFGVLKKRWQVLSRPARYWDRQRMSEVMYACIILHNMILEDEGRAICQNLDPEDPSLDLDYWTQPSCPMKERVQNTRDIKSRETHSFLTMDLIEHQWANRNQSQPEEDQFPDVNDYVPDDV